MEMKNHWVQRHDINVKAFSALDYYILVKKKSNWTLDGGTNENIKNMRTVHLTVDASLWVSLKELNSQP